MATVVCAQVMGNKYPYLCTSTIFQKVILQTIHINQYGFLKDRVTQDCLGWSYEYIHQCLKSKEEMLVPKLDFKKDFDTVEHQAIIDILRAKRFGEKLISRI